MLAVLSASRGFALHSSVDCAGLGHDDGHKLCTVSPLAPLPPDKCGHGPSCLGTDLTQSAKKMACYVAIDICARGYLTNLIKHREVSI